MLKAEAMARDPWSWDPDSHYWVVSVLSEPAADLAWCVRLDHAPMNAVVGKVLCVCAAAAIARAVLATSSGVGPAATDALTLLDDWIDDPTEERFDRIGEIIFQPENAPDLDPFGVVWWALRTATSTAEGYGEAGWALETTCSAALRAGLTSDQLRVIAERAVLARQSKPS